MSESVVRRQNANFNENHEHVIFGPQNCNLDWHYWTGACAILDWVSFFGLLPSGFLGSTILLIIIPAEHSLY